jgi:hypothetical protein
LNVREAPVFESVTVKESASEEVTWPLNFEPSRSLTSARASVPTPICCTFALASDSCRAGSAAFAEAAGVPKIAESRMPESMIEKVFLNNSKISLN